MPIQNILRARPLKNIIQGTAKSNSYTCLSGAGMGLRLELGLDTWKEELVCFQSEQYHVGVVHTMSQ